MLTKISSIGVAIMFISLFVISNSNAGTAYTTLPASKITKSSATLNGSSASTLCPTSGKTFHWGTQPETLSSSLGASPTGGNSKSSAKLKGLTCDTTYYYQLTGIACPPRTTIQGQVLQFTTAACERKYESLDAGPIWDNNDAQSKCPNVCANAKGTWSGQWLTTVQGQMSVCGCWIAGK